MPSGSKNVVIQTQERAISPDINRLQSQGFASVAEILRYLLDVTGNDDLDAGGVITEHTSLETPMRGEIINGLLVQPQIGAGVLDLFVTPGCAMVIAPDAAPDDSKYKLAVDPGIQAGGILQMTTNPAGSIRIDVVEVQWSNVVVESDNRDIFNATTGLFSADNVTKVTQGTVTKVGGAANIRVRAGTAGAGFPGVVNGWMPLAVVSLPAGCTTCDTMTFWDVRPLINDRELPGGLTRGLERQISALWQSSPNAGATSLILSGNVEATLLGRRVGGRLQRGTPGTDAATINLGPATTDNLEHAFATAPNVLAHLYLMTPFGLPRWARYTDASSGSRKPRSPRGIPVLSRVGPNVDGTPSAAITLPDSTGLVLTSSVGICVGSFELNGAGTQFLNMHADKSRQIIFGSTVDLAIGPNNAITGLILSRASGDANTSKWNLVANTHFPANARRIRLLVAHAFTGAVMILRQAVCYYPADAVNAYYVTYLGCSHLDAVAAAIDLVDIWVPVPPIYPGITPANVSFTLEFRTDSGGTYLGGTPMLSVMGWES